MVYELNNQLQKSVFYNGVLEVVEASGFVSGCETLERSHGLLRGIRQSDYGN